MYYIFDLFDLLGEYGINAVILSIIAVILLFVFVVPEKKKPKLNKFGKFLHDTFNFKYLIIEKILQALYIFLTSYIMIMGFFMLFDYAIYGIMVMLLGPIVIRFAYELLMMAVLVVKNVISINNKLKNQNEIISALNSNNDSQKKWSDNVQNDASCPNCGTVVQSGTFCTKCGTKV